MIALKLTCLFQGILMVMCIPLRFDWQDSQLIGHINQNTSKSSDCGQQLVRKPKIISGELAYHGEFPWMVSIQHKRGHICGGSLINKQWVLTAAHCFADAKRNQDMASYKLVVGLHTLSQTTVPDTSEKISLEKVISNDQFSTTTFTKDIALVKLAKPVNWDNYKQPICLPNDDEINLSPQEVTVIGWGWTKEPGFGGKMSDILQKVKVKIINNSDCAAWYRQAGFPNSYLPGHLCAGVKEGGKDSCVGDSGGPLMVKRGNSFVLVGIVSSGIGCARPLLPGLYTNVANFLPWIRKNIS